jgi:hypothetical protein
LNLKGAYFRNLRLPSKNMENKTLFWKGAIILLYYIFSSNSEKPAPTAMPSYLLNNYVSPRGS